MPFNAVITMNLSDSEFRFGTNWYLVCVFSVPPMLQLGISVSPQKLESRSSSYRRYTELTFRCYVKKAKVVFFVYILNVG